MKSTLLAVSVLASAFSAGAAAPAWAQHWGKSAPGTSPQSKSKPDSSGLSSYSATFLFPSNTPSNSKCNVDYSSVCGSGSCHCFDFVGSGKGTFGKTVTSSDAELFMTLDDGDSVITNNSSNPDAQCFPVTADLFITGTKDNELIFLNGAACDLLNGTGPFVGGFILFNGNSVTLLEAAGIQAGTFTTQGFKLILNGNAVKNLVD